MSKLTIFQRNYRVRVVSAKSNHRFSVEGATAYWGTAIGMKNDDLVLVRITDSDNKVKIKAFNWEEVNPL